MSGMRARLGALAVAFAALSTGPGGSPAAYAAPAPAAAAAPQVTTVKVGPFVLPPAPMGSLPEQNRFVPAVPKPCTDCFITGVVPELVYADGTRADMDTGVMLHHLVIFEPGKADVTCGRTHGIGALGRRIFASGDERTPFTLPTGFGFRVDPGRWTGVVELMNHSNTAKTVFFEAVVTHVPGSTPGMKPVTPVWMDVADCSNSQYAVPAGHSATPWTWNSTLTGRIVAAAGHVHPGGQGVVVDNASTGQRICASRATYGKGMFAGMVTAMSGCSWDSLGVVHKGDNLRLTSIYDAPRSLSGVMGIMVMAVYETTDLASGTPAPASMRRTPDTAVPADIADDSGMHQSMPGMGEHQGH
jgi:hypothetical protein